MKKSIRLLLPVLLLCMVSVPSFAATYDATGQWFIETTPGQSIGPIPIPEAGLNALIDQDENFFSIETEEIEELGGISFYGTGSVDGAAYLFDPPLSETFDLSALIPNLPGELTIALAGFDLTSANTLSGYFTLPDYNNFQITFEGTKANVPLPAAVWLLGTGLFGLLGLRRRHCSV